MPVRSNFGWIRDRRDDRDVPFKVRVTRVALPPVFSVEPQVSWVYDQGNIGSCVGNGVGAAFRLECQKQGMTEFDPSRLFAYYQGRAAIDTIGEDSGCQIRDVIKSINKVGICGEPTWPYIVERFTQAPPEPAYVEAERHQSVEYARVDARDIDAVKAAIFEGGGRLVPFGVPLYPGMMRSETMRTGDIPTPRWWDWWRSIGGHCMALGGWDDGRQRFDVLNSWGRDVGRGGWFTISYSYIRSKASDLWAIHKVEA